MKKAIKIFFVFHILLIFISSIFLTITSYLEFKNKLDNKSSVYLNGNWLLNNPLFYTYKIISGTNTGYGFYGINVGTEAYFLVKVYDKKNNLIYTTTTHGITKKNSITRFMTLSCSELCSNSDIEKEKNELKKAKKAIKINVNEVFSNKIFKYIGLYDTKNINKSDYEYYTVSLYCLNPKNIWNLTKTKNDIKKTKIKELKFYK